MIYFTSLVKGFNPSKTVHMGAMFIPVIDKLNPDDFVIHTNNFSKRKVVLLPFIKTEKDQYWLSNTKTALAVHRLCTTATEIIFDTNVANMIRMCIEGGKYIPSRTKTGMCFTVINVMEDVDVNIPTDISTLTSRMKKITYEEAVEYMKQNSLTFIN